MKNAFLLFLSIVLIACKKETRKGPPGGPPGRESFAEVEAKALKEDYQGIFIEGEELEDLFPIQATGISTDSIVEAGTNLLNLFSTEEREKVQFPHKRQ